MSKKRLDILLIEHGLAESRAKAQALIMAGQVRVNDQVVDKPSVNFLPEVHIAVDVSPRYVSRGGQKLEAALATFDINIHGRVCADVGASTGGFTDCLLQHGAKKVYAIDVGKGILHWKLRTLPQVVVMEETNARFLESLPEIVSLVTIDASFISLKVLLPVVKKWFFSQSSLPSLSKAPKVNGNVIALIKPQFEAGRKESAHGRGVIRSPKVHQEVLLDVLTFAQAQGITVQSLMRSPLLGPKGNTEFFTWLGWGKEEINLSTLIEKALANC